MRSNKCLPSSHEDRRCVLVHGSLRVTHEWNVLDDYAARNSSRNTIRSTIDWLLTSDQVPFHRDRLDDLLQPCHQRPKILIFPQVWSFQWAWLPELVNWHWFNRSPSIWIAWLQIGSSRHYCRDDCKRRCFLAWVLMRRGNQQGLTLAWSDRTWNRRRPRRRHAAIRIFLLFLPPHQRSKHLVDEKITEKVVGEL